MYYFFGWYWVAEHKAWFHNALLQACDVFASMLLSSWQSCHVQHKCECKLYMAAPAIYAVTDWNIFKNQYNNISAVIALIKTLFTNLWEAIRGNGRGESNICACGTTGGKCELLKQINIWRTRNNWLCLFKSVSSVVYFENVLRYLSWRQHNIQSFYHIVCYRFDTWNMQ